MSNGVNRRSEIDTEHFKALVLINGGGAVALLAMIPAMIEKADYICLTRAIMGGVFLMALGLVFAVIHNRYRRLCSLTYDQHNMRPPSGVVFGRALREPTVCAFSNFFMWASLIIFIMAVLVVAASGLWVIREG